MVSTGTVSNANLGNNEYEGFEGFSSSETRKEVKLKLVASDSDRDSTLGWN